MGKGMLLFKVMVALFFVTGFFVCEVLAQHKGLEELPKKGWVVTASSSMPESSPSRLVDNNTNTTWHTPIGPSAPGYPHWFMLDMKQHYTISHVVLYKRPKVGNGFGDFEIWGSMDGASFTQYGGTYTLDQSADLDNKPQYFEVDGNPTVRYIKIVALRVAESWKDQHAYYTVLSEFGAVGRKDELRH